MSQSGIANIKAIIIAAGDVVGPASAVNNDIAVFDGTTGKLIKDGGQVITPQMKGTYKATAVSYQVLVTDYIIGVTDTSSARTITMPASGMYVGQPFVIKDESVNASNNNITIVGNAGNIVGNTSATTIAINVNGGAYNMYWNGTTLQVT